MNLKKFITSPTIGHALIWAWMMIAGSILLRGTDRANDLLLLHIVGWTTCSALVARLEKARKRPGRDQQDRQCDPG